MTSDQTKPPAKEPAPLDGKGKQTTVGYLIVEHPDGRTQKVLIPVNRELTVGRSNRNDIIVDGANVSRCHVVFRTDGSSILVIDTGHNPTLVNGSELLHVVRRLESGDVLVISDTRLTYFDIEVDDTGSLA